MNKAKFVKIDVTITHKGGGEPYSFTEWFCLGETWTHPYNRRNALAAEFQQWCKTADESIKKTWPMVVCPYITIGGNPLQDGWGSDIDGRICVDFSHDETMKWGDAVEEALKTGNVQSLVLENADTKLETTFTPYDTITPDPESGAAFGPYAEVALEGLK